MGKNTKLNKDSFRLLLKDVLLFRIHSIVVKIDNKNNIVFIKVVLGLINYPKRFVYKLGINRGKLATNYINHPGFPAKFLEVLQQEPIIVSALYSDYKTDSIDKFIEKLNI